MSSSPRGEAFTPRGNFKSKTSVVWSTVSKTLTSPNGVAFVPEEYLEIHPMVSRLNNNENMVTAYGPPDKLQEFKDLIKQRTGIEIPPEINSVDIEMLPA